MRQIHVRVKPKVSRLDKFLSVQIKSLSRSQAKKIIEQNSVSVNGKAADPDYEVRKGDLIKVQLPSPKRIEIKPETAKLSIIYEDEAVLVIDKPEGMVVHPTADHTSGTLVNALLGYLKKGEKFTEGLRPGIVHRLDKGTSGLLLVAKTEKALEELKKQFKARSVVKKYLALVQGKLEPGIGNIEKSIGRHPKYRQKFTVAADGKEAATDYRVLEYLDSYSLVELEPKTGRTHQLRVHLSSLGHPILGDKLYGAKGASRMFLHANFISFRHPLNKIKMEFKTPLPGQLEEILEKLKK